MSLGVQKHEEMKKKGPQKGAVISERRGAGKMKILLRGNMLDGSGGKIPEMWEMEVRGRPCILVMTPKTGSCKHWQSRNEHNFVPSLPCPAATSLLGGAVGS